MDTIEINDTPKHNPVLRILKIVCPIIGLAMTAVLLWNMLFCLNSVKTSDAEVPEVTEAAESTEPMNIALMDSFDTFMADTLSEAYEGAKSVRKFFWIEDDVEIPPLPDAAKYGETTDPATLQWLIDEAAGILEGQELTFSTDVEIFPGSKVTYYLDDSILAITWKAVYYDFVYTFCEVKVSHPSQVRRFIAEGTFGSDYLYRPTTMASMVNAVAAMSGDYYRGRNYGIVVYDGVVYQASHCQNVDTCYVDYDGNFHFTYRGEVANIEEAQKFVDDNNISFSFAFGPILVDDGVRCEPPSYALGEVNDEYPRAGICQKDELHYILVTANWEGAYYHSPTIHTFAAVIDTLGVKMAYTLDGGKTGAIAMDGKLMNPTHRGEQRRISDIIYFATAVPNYSDTTEATESAE